MSSVNSPIHIRPSDHKCASYFSQAQQWSPPTLSEQEQFPNRTTPWPHSSHNFARNSVEGLVEKKGPVEKKTKKHKRHCSCCRYNLQMDWLLACERQLLQGITNQAVNTSFSRMNYGFPWASKAQQPSQNNACRALVSGLITLMDVTSAVLAKPIEALVSLCSISTHCRASQVSYQQQPCIRCQYKPPKIDLKF